jgi:four helix bundle protein
MENGKKENIIQIKSFQFAVRIVRLYQFLVKQKNEFVLSKQILRSGTSIGANVEEADGAISKREFSNKISISYKEAKETHYWLRLLHATDYISQSEYESLLNDCNEICRLLCSILRTSRSGKTSQ